MADEGTIDWLAIEVSGDSSAAMRGIDALVSSLGRLDKSLSSPIKKLGQMSRALRQLKSDASGINLSGIKVSASASKNISTLAGTLRGIDAKSSGGVGQLASALNSLSALDTRGIGRTITQLKKLPAVFSEFSKLNINGLTAQLDKLNRSLAPVARNVAKLSSAVNSLPRSLRTAGAAARTVAASNKYLDLSYRNASSGASSLTLRTKGLLAASQGAFAGLAYLINQSTKYVEDMNLFEASMGDATQAATEFGQKCQDLLGIDFGELARNQGVFETLITGMGETKEHADVMSQQLTQLGYDIASFFNISTEDAMLKIQSGIAGELEPLRRIGWDLSDARMQLEATNLGISTSTQNMTQAEKVALRYYMIMNQVTIVHGDMARTIASPANQLRVLRMQLQLAARTVGNLFIPSLNAILPVAIAVVKAITMVAQAIASLFGIDATFEVDYSGLDTSGIASGADDASDAIDDVGDSASDAAGKVKELKNTVMGFDELNKLNDDSDSGSNGGSGSGAGGAGGVGGFDVPLDTYDFFDGLTDKMNEAASELAEKMVDALKTIAPIAAGVGAAFLAWKLAPKLLGDVAKLKTLMTALKEAKGLQQIGSVLASALGIANPLALGIAASIGIIVGHFANLAINSENFRRGCVAAWDALTDFASNIGPILDGLWNVLATPLLQSLGIDISPITDALGKVASMVNEVFDLQWTDALMVAATAVASVLCPPLAVAIGVLEGVSLAIRAVGYAVSPVCEQVDALGGVSEETAERFGTSLDSMTDAVGILDKYSLSDAAVSEEDVETVKSRIQDVHDTIVNNLDAKRNEELANIDLLEGLMPEEELQAAKDRVNQFYDDQINQADQGQSRITAIYMTAANDNRKLSQSEKDEIAAIQQQMQEELIQSSGATADEIQSIQENMKNNNTAAALEQSQSIIKAAIEERDSRVQAAWDTYDGQMQALDGMLRAGEITEQQYDAMSQAALSAAQAEQDAANDAYYGENGVVNKVKSGLGDASTQMDYNTGEMKTNWRVFCEDLSANASSMAEGVTQRLDEFTENGRAAVNDFVKNTGDGISNWVNERESDFENFKSEAGQKLSSFADGAEAVLTTFTTGAGTTLATFASDAVSNLKSMGDEAGSNWSSFVDGMSGAWSGAITTIGSWYSSNLRPLFDGVSSLAFWAGNAIYSYLTNPIGWITGAWVNIGNWFWYNVADPIVNAFWTIPNTLRSAMNWIIGRLNGLRINLPLAVQQVTGWSSIGFSIPYLANGGQIDAGQLFVARESGPELVGTMGGKTTVANNDQIVAGIERGVINAMVQVMGNQQGGVAGDTQVTFVVGAEELARTVVKGMRTLDARGEISVDFA